MKIIVPGYEKYVKGMTFHYVNTLKEVTDIALLNEKIEGAITID